MLIDKSALVIRHSTVQGTQTGSVLSFCKTRVINQIFMCITNCSNINSSRIFG